LTLLKFFSVGRALEEIGGTQQEEGQDDQESSGSEQQSASSSVSTPSPSNTSSIWKRPENDFQRIVNENKRREKDALAARKRKRPLKD